MKGGVQKDGEHYIKVRSSILQIFCAGMQSSFPKEYVTLRSGQNDNYSEVYGLQNPSECLYNGSRRQDCACRRDYAAAGYTIFHRVRLDLSSMRIITTDVKFSQTLLGRSVLGQFSINLSGTGLRVTESTKWVSQGNYVTLKVHRSQYLTFRPQMSPTAVPVFQLYKQDCETFGIVMKMLTSKDQTLKPTLLSALYKNLVEIWEKYLENIN
ncbi:A disintegrin and metalloproteinase with thrombospondin motifs 9-like [Cyprinus carpio]|uniref:A disintegrin and metalloproteinase with thrombospondin motifs 9-like n=1 Tax=Cyprinus carpio TaxID=7962 RepID=A0A9Q9ZS54_CYPCA|nr:A disintegrin and metalloproteinase with thrombospondin motifs 9-like [Cyprinus carpio]